MVLAAPGPLRYIKLRGGTGGQIEEKEENGARPVGLPNIDSNCHVSPAIHLAAIVRGYNEVTIHSYGNM